MCSSIVGSGLTLLVTNIGNHIHCQLAANFILQTQLGLCTVNCASIR